MNEQILSRVCFIGALIAVVGVLAEPSAYATPENEARALNAQGHMLLDEGDFVGALELFRAAYARYPNIKLLLNIGTALRNLGRYAEAADAYERYVNDSGAEPKRRAECLKILEELRRHIGSLHVEVNEPGARVIVDGKPLGGSPQSVTIRVEEGSHTIVAEKEGYAVAAATVPIKPGDERTVELRLTRPGPNQPELPSPRVEAIQDADEHEEVRSAKPPTTNQPERQLAASSATPKPTESVAQATTHLPSTSSSGPSAVERARHRDRVIALGFGAATVAFAAVALGFSVDALHLQQQLSAGYGTVDEDTRRQQKNTVLEHAAIADGFWAATAATAIVTAYFVYRGFRHASSERRLTLAPTLRGVVAGWSF